MIIYPAIDLIDGKCVRLYQGDFDAVKTYDKTPLDVVKSYANDGASWVHIVDLDGARNPKDRQQHLIADLAAKSGLNIQSGGGIRNLQDVENLLSTGVKRVIIGSLAIREPNVVKDAIKQFGDAICLAVDVTPVADEAEKYKVAISGWQESSDLLLEDVLADFTGTGLKHILCTDISRDGTLGGSNISLYRTIKKTYPDLDVQASGGVSGLDDIIALHDIGADGVIIGKALYEGKMSLADAISIGGQQC